MGHHTGEILAPFGLLIAFIGIAQYNATIGAITGTIALIYTGFKLYNEIKIFRKNRNKTDIQN